jgi:hypothetical protein
MFTELIVLSPAVAGDNSDNIKKLARFQGIENIRQLNLSPTPWDTVRDLLARGQCCITAGGSEFLAAIEQSGRAAYARECLSKKPHNLYLHGFSNIEADAVALRKLTGGVISCIHPAGKMKSTFRLDFDCPLTGQRLREVAFSAETDRECVCFSLNTSAPMGHSPMRVGDLPFFVQLEIGQSKLYLSGGATIADIDALVPKEKGLLSYAPSFLPALIFLRDAFGDECWHNPSPKACLIIDDPLLTRKYGFINFSDLLEVVEDEGLSISFAFIPWNWKRTQKEVADLFLSNPERYSLAVHGCDHTWAEFGAPEEWLLLEKSAEAMRRMKLHRDLTSIPFSPLMVFPQGIFSAKALNALKLTGFVAAVNSTPYAVGTDDTAIALSDLMDGAVRKYSNLPLFLRRYPRDSALTAVEMFLGKPVLLAEHHGFFRNGYGALRETAERLRRWQHRLQWKTLEAVCCSYFLLRRSRPGEIHVRFFTDLLLLKNPFEEPYLFRLYRYDPDVDSIESVEINDHFSDFLM